MLVKKACCIFYRLKKTKEPPDHFWKSGGPVYNKVVIAGTNE